MLLVIARHGETVANNDDLLQGQLPGELSERGWLQAKALAKELSGRVFDVVFSSDLKRGRDTAEEVNKYHKVPHIIDERARERSFGVFQGTNRTRFYREERDLDEPHRHRPKDGESFEDLHSRTLAFLEEVEKKYPDKRVLIIAHGDFARMCIGILTGKSVADACKIVQANACINILEVKKGLKGRPVLLNSTEHLGSSLLSNNKSAL